MTTRKIADSALNTIMMVSFAIPGGAPVGILAAIAMFVGNFIPDPDSKPSPPPVTDDELKTALNDVKMVLINGLWNAEADTVTNQILAFNTGIANNWVWLKKLQFDTKTYVIEVTNPTIKGWVDSLDSDLVVDTSKATNTLLILRGYRNTMENSSLNDPNSSPLAVAEHRTAHTAVYSLIGSLSATYLKIAVTWQWGKMLLMNEQYAQWKQALADWESSDPADQAAYPKTQLLSDLKSKYTQLGKFGYDSYVPKDWNAWLEDAGCPQGIFISEVQSLVDYCIEKPAQNGNPAQDGLYTTLRKHWDDFDAQISKDVPLTPNAGITKAQMQSAISLGQTRMVLWDTIQTKYALYGVVEDDIVEFGQTIDNWRAAAASVNYKLHTVAAGDTLTTIAQHEYNDPSLAAKIFAFNQPPLTDANVLPLGAILKIFAKDAIPYVQITKAGA